MVGMTRLEPDVHWPTVDPAPAVSRFLAAAGSAVAAQGYRPLWAGIDTQALRCNAGLIRRHLAPDGFCAVLKGDAYGHGADLVAQAIVADCSHIAICDNREAVAVRKASAEIPVLRLRIGAPGEIAAAMADGLCLRETVGSLEAARIVSDLATGHRRVQPVHLNLDVAGSGRTGLNIAPMRDCLAQISSILALPWLRIASLGCHLPDAASANASDPDDPSRRGIARFQEIVANALPLFREAGEGDPEISLFSSAASAVFGGVDDLGGLGLRRFDRIGNALYGTANGMRGPFAGTRQVMHVATSVCDCMHRPQGATIGYEHAYRIGERSGQWIALLGFGWLSAGRTYQGIGKTETPACVLNAHGGAHRLVGRQSMNMSTVEAEDPIGRRLSCGDHVFVTTDWWGARTPADISSLAAWMGDVQPEFVTSVLGCSPSTLRFSF